MKRYKIAVLILSFIILIQAVFIALLIRPKRAPVPKAAVAVLGKIAIVIDDWGYNLNNLYILDQIKYPLTVSILPNLNYSNSVARESSRRGLEIILHLPLEPHEKFRLEQNTIMTSMDEEAIRRIVREDLESISYAKGVSNHMGSRATQDPRTMEIVFRELQKRHLYFLDSLVSAESICFDLADKMNLGFIKRDVFLDNEEEAGYILSQLDKLKLRARVYGQAIGIGHDRKVTLEVLKDAMPKIAKEGYKFVFVSELIK